MALTIATEYNLECWQLDCNIAFQTAELEAEVYENIAPEYEAFDGVVDHGSQARGGSTHHGRGTS